MGKPEKVCFDNNENKNVCSDNMILGFINQLRPAAMKEGRLLTGNYLPACAIIPLFLTDSVDY